jgi:antitoxin (DNA-binding transcriptional repressor) of toxin-antitoxin stability system
MDVSIPVTEARATLAELLERVGDGDEVTLTRHGEPVAVLVRPDVLRARRMESVAGGAESVRELLHRGRSRPLGKPTLSPERAKELVAEVESGRSAR